MISRSQGSNEDTRQPPVVQSGCTPRNTEGSLGRQADKRPKKGRPVMVLWRPLYSATDGTGWCSILHPSFMLALVFGPERTSRTKRTIGPEHCALDLLLRSITANKGAYKAIELNKAASCWRGQTEARPSLR